MIRIAGFLSLLLIISSCTPLEVGRTIWGTSVRALDEARPEGFKKIYQCQFDACFDAVLSLERKEKVIADPKESFKIFFKDRVRSVIVVYGIVGQVDTTEVGIFFTRVNNDKYAVEISSLSTSAKEKVALLVYNKLNQTFQEVTE